jgi:hypothetical protein
MADEGLPEPEVSEPGPRATGRALARDDADLDRLSVVTAGDIEAGRRDWVAKSEPRWAGLVDAERDDDPDYGG